MLDTGFFCLDCKVHTAKIGEYYMLNDDVWIRAHPGARGMLCVGCVETRMGRRLARSDFRDCPLTTMPSIRRSPRLTDRLRLRRS